MNQETLEQFFKHVDNQDEIDFLLRKLDVNDRKLLIQRFYKGWSFSKIAKVNHTTKVAIKHRFYRIMQILKGIKDEDSTNKSN